MVICIVASAQVPESFNYQVVVRDGFTNDPFVNQNVSFRMSILKGNSSGASQYSELHNANTGELGIVNLVIGNGTGKTGSITTIDWGADIYFLKIEIDKTGGTSYIEIGTIQLLSVPYALYAKTPGISKNNKPYDLYITEHGDVIGLTKISVEKPYSLMPTETDEDGNNYGTVKIGTQVWMAENLKTTKYNDKTLIPLVTDNAAWAVLSTPAYCWYDNNIANKAVYGALYNMFAVATNKLCPTGWHVPTDADWTVLTSYLGVLAGGRLKEAGTTHWNEPNTDAINDSQFSALPGASRDAGGEFTSILRESGSWWSSTDESEGLTYYRTMSNSGSEIKRYYDQKENGFSVRCIKD